jgi:DNA-binding NarL/FixJ family response regulator
MLGENRDQFSNQKLLSNPNLTAAFPSCVIIVETRALIRECLALCLQKKLELPVLAYPDVASWSDDPASASACLVILSGSDRQFEQEESAVIAEVTRWSKQVPVVVFADNESRINISQILKWGARGYIPSNMPLEIVARAIKLVLVGGVFIPANMVLEPSEKGELQQPAPQPPKFGFTAREQEVVNALLKGKSNKIIAYELNMSESSVKVHIRNVMRKLGAKNRTEAVIKIAEALGDEPASHDTAHA